MIEINKLTKIFKSGNGIKDIDLKIKKGEILAILGPNGAGKSTLLKLIFNEYKSDSGEIKLDEDITLKKFSFFTDQSLFPKDITLGLLCTYSAELAGVDKKEAKKRMLHLLKELDLIEYKNKNFKTLSAGMQKRAMLAITLINEPDFLFLDEPTANLDINSRVEFLKLLKNLKNENKAVIITSHILDELQNFIDRVVIIDGGKISLDTIFDKNKDNLEQIYFSNISNDKKEKTFANLTNWEK